MAYFRRGRSGNRRKITFIAVQLRVQSLVSSYLFLRFDDLFFMSSGDAPAIFRLLFGVNLFITESKLPILKYFLHAENTSKCQPPTTSNNLQLPPTTSNYLQLPPNYLHYLHYLHYIHYLLLPHWTLGQKGMLPIPATGLVSNR